MLKKLTLRRFKKFYDTTIDLQPFTILMGENSSGKTTIIQAINLAHNIFARTDMLYVKNGRVSVREKGIGMTELPGVSISDFRELYYAKISRTNQHTTLGDGSIGAYLELTDTFDNSYKLQISSLFGGFNLKCISKPSELGNNPTLQDYKPLYISGFIGLRSTEERSFPVAIQDRLLSGEASTIIRNLLLDAKTYSPDGYLKLKSRLERNFGFYLDDVVFKEDQDLHVKAQYKETCEKNKLILDFTSSGSGFMQILQILTPIYRYCPDKCKVVLLDEPDAHLHPNLQATLAKTLREIQEELGIQIIISTHSTSIIRAANPNEVIPVSSSNPINSPLTSKADVEQEISGKIDTYELGKTVISGKLIFFEDSNVDIFETFDMVAGTNCFNGANTVPVITGRSKDDKVPFQLSRVFESFLDKKVEIHFIRDGDGLNNQWRDELRKYSEAQLVKLHHLQRHEAENYLLVPALIERTLFRKFQGRTIPSIKEIETMIIEALRSTIIYSKYRFDDLLEDSIYKTAMLMSKSEYRNPQISKSEAIKIREQYDQLSSIEELVLVGMGKESLKIVFQQLNDDFKLNISKADLLRNVEIGDITPEMLEMLNVLKSNAQKISPEPLVTMESVSVTSEEQAGDLEIIGQLRLF
ncbi:AAA family ATPase [Cohnella sp. GbtcB17]|uniref:AAA family ATPase n=1 Tax=Cohnella sp. GbtcB17 TaxID=2824762 RepID=UPI001C2FB847|nr:ATP-binding protein [Cohnella sp. GbtcB17]